jgi:DNA ligase (NAD+)
MLPINELADLIRYHAHKYFVDNAPEITDAEFDGLVAEMRARDPGNAVLTEIGAPLAPTYGLKVKHPVPMGSLNKASNWDELLVWWNKVNYPAIVGSPKVDGLAVRLNYENGKLVIAATRGDGSEGQLVTDNARAVKNIPSVLSTDWTGEVRGEIYMPRSVFQDLLDGGMKLANCRNAAAGAMGLEDPREVAQRRLSFMCYGAGRLANFPTSHLNMGLPKEFADVCVRFSQPCNTEQQVKDVVDYWTAQRAGLDYDIDGIVFSIEDADTLADAGESGGCPSGRVAYKFATEQVHTIVREMHWFVGRTGKVTPLAVMDPVKLAGSTVSKATLHSYKMVQELNIGVDDEVLLEKGGDIIPHIIRVTTRTSSGPVYPTHCPDCGDALIVEGAHLWCRNPFCGAKLEERVLYYLRTLGIKGIGPAFVSAVCGAGHLVKTIPDLYCLDPNDVAVILGSEVTANQSVLAILDKHTVDLAKFLEALGVPGLGEEVSVVLANHYGTLAGAAYATVDELLKLPGFKVTKATTVANGLLAVRKEICELSTILTIKDPEVKTGKLVGKSFCLTGAMTRPRTELETMITGAGGTVKGSVGKGLTYLVQADPTSTSTKTVAAAKHGVQVISENDLVAML